MKRLRDMPSRKELVEELLGDIQAIRRVMGFGHKGEITPAQWSVLALLFHHGSMTVKEVAAALGISSSAATQLLDVLVKAGHITRKESTRDRRAVELSVSKKTSARIAKMRQQHAERLLSTFECLSDAEFTQYVTLNKKLAASILKNHHDRHTK